MKLKLWLTTAAALLITISAHAEVTYTPTQLQQMVNSGNTPKQGSPTTQKQSMSFSACVSKVNDIVASIRDQYPAQTLVDTKIMHMTKLWTNDAAMTLTCSEPDRVLVITSAKYL